MDLVKLNKAIENNGEPVEVSALINLMTQRFFYYDEVLYFPRSIEGMRKHLVKLENKVRKR